jgi:hypothetical protein
MSEKVHEVKSWPDFFEPVFGGEKTFELRINDRHYKAGDVLHLREYDDRKGVYTGRAMKRKITYVFEGLGQGAVTPYHGLARGYAILALGEILSQKCGV